MKHYTLALNLFILLFFAACADKDKKNDPAPAAPTKTSLLTAKAWRQTGATISPSINVNGTQISNIWNQNDIFPACLKDDLTKFNSNGSGQFDEGATKCNTSDPQSIPFTWVWNSNETVLTITEGGDSFSNTIKTLTASSLVMEFQEQADFGSGTLTYTITETYVSN